MGQATGPFIQQDGEKISTFVSTEKLGEMMKSDPDIFSSRENQRALVGRLMERGFEVEGANTDFSPFTALEEFVPSLREAGTAIWEAFKGIPTGQTLDGISATGRGAIQVLAKSLGFSDKVARGALRGVQISPFTSFLFGKVGEEKKSDEATFKALVNHYQQRFGSLDKALETLERDPAGFLLDLSGLISAGGAGVRATSFVAKATKLQRTAQFLGTTADKAAKFAIIADPFQQAATVGVRLPAKLANKFTSVKFFNQKAIEFAEKSIPGLSRQKAASLARKTFKEPFGKTLADFEIKGDLPSMQSQLLNLAEGAKFELSGKLSTITDTFRGSNIRKALKEIIPEFQNVKSAEFIRLRNKLQGYLEKHDGKIKEVDVPAEVQVPSQILSETGQPFQVTKKVTQRVQKKGKPEGLTISEVNEIKQIIDRYDSPYGRTANIQGVGKVDFSKLDVPSKDLKSIRDKLQKIVEEGAARNGIKNVKDLNKRISFGTDAERIVEDAILSGASPKSFFSELIFLMGVGGSVMSTNLKVMLIGSTLTLLKRGMQSPKFRSIMAVELAKLSRGKQQIIERAMKAGRLTPEAINVFQEVSNNIQRSVPAARLTSIINETQIIPQDQQAKK